MSDNYGRAPVEPHASDTIESQPEPQASLRQAIAGIVGPYAVASASPVQAEASRLGNFEHPVLTPGQETFLFTLARQAGDETRPSFSVSVQSMLGNDAFVEPIRNADPETRTQWAHLLLSCSTIGDLLIRCNQRLIVAVANTYKGFDLPFESKIAAGNAALGGLLARYDASEGVKFSTFAWWQIYGAIQQADAEFHGLTLHQLRAIRRMMYYRATFRRATQRDPSVQELRDITILHARSEGVQVYMHEALRFAPLVLDGARSLVSNEYDAADFSADAGDENMQTTRPLTAGEPGLHIEISDTLQAALARLPADQRQAVMRSFGLEDGSLPEDGPAGNDEPEDPARVDAALESLRNIMQGNEPDIAQLLASAGQGASTYDKVIVLVQHGFDRKSIQSALAESGHQVSRQAIDQALARAVRNGMITEMPPTAYQSFRQQVRDALESGMPPAAATRKFGASKMMVRRLVLALLEEHKIPLEIVPSATYCLYLKRHITPEMLAFEEVLRADKASRTNRVSEPGNI